MGDDFVHRIDGTARDTNVAECVNPIVCCPLRQNLRKDWEELIVVFGPVCVRPKPFIRNECLPADMLTKLCPEGIVSEGNNNVSVSRCERLKGCNRRMSGTERFRCLTCCEIANNSVFQNSNEAIQHCNIDKLSAPRLVAMVQCRKDTDRREERSGNVADRGADTHRRSVGFTCDTDNTPHPLDNHIIRPLLCVGTRLSKTGTRRINKRRILRFERAIIQPQFFHRSRSEILHENIGLVQQPLEYCASAFGLEVERHAPLPTIDAHEVETKPVFEGTEIARLVPCAGLFNLDDLRTEIAEKHGRIRTGEHACQVQDLYTVQGTCHFQLLRV